MSVVEPGENARPKAETWVCACFIWDARKRASLGQFSHLIRSPDDPKPISRAAKQVGDGGRAASSIAWKADLRDSDPVEWAYRIMELLADGRAMTFNRIVLELTERRYTADIAYEKAPDTALWSLAKDCCLESTTEAPFLFRSLAFDAVRGRAAAEGL